MEKKRLFKIMSQMTTLSIQSISETLRDKYKIIIIKEPNKTLAMIKMREPVKSSLFYIGEVIVCEAIVELEGVKGIAVIMGTDYEKVLNMAIIDAAYSKNVKEVGKITSSLLIFEKAQQEKIKKENAMHLKTMVNFNSMDSEVIQ